MTRFRSKEESHQRNTHPRIAGKRCFVDGNHKIHKTHATFRHQNYNGLPLNYRGDELVQGTLFPKYIKAGDITWIEEYIAKQWRIHTTKEKLKIYKRKNLTKKQRVELRKRSKISKIVATRVGVRVKVRLNKFGIKYVGAFLLDGVVNTVFPEENTKGTPLIDKGKKVNKSSRRLK